LNKIICGIDPGLKGGFGFITLDGQVNSFASMPILKNGTKSVIDAYGVAMLLKQYKPDYVAIEKVHAMPKQGVTSTFTFGRGVGILEGALSALEIPYIDVTPQCWQKALFLGLEASMGKQRSIMAVKRRWPTTCGGKLTDGQADALCLAVWLLSSGLSAQAGLDETKYT
jgi:crossover junction endodeoxyribonuclease RuvC